MNIKKILSSVMENNNSDLVNNYESEPQEMLSFNNNIINFGEKKS